MAQNQKLINGKLFDIHLEIGIANPGPGFYAKTILGHNGIIFEAVHPNSVAAAVAKVAIDLEGAGMWTLIHNTPAIASYPFGSAPSAVTQPTSTYDPKAPKKRPSDLHGTTHPDCQMMCQSFDHFGTSKCKSICGQRTGL